MRKENETSHCEIWNEQQAASGALTRVLNIAFSCQFSP